MSAIFGAVVDFLSTWTTPHMVCIKDGRLGLLFWATRVAILSYLVYQIADEHRYRLVETPTGIPSFWFENGRLFEAQNRAEPYCDNAEYDYWYVKDPLSYWIDKGARCLSLQPGQMYEKQTMGAYVFTFMKMLHMKTESCSAESACPAMGSGLDGREHRDMVVSDPATGGKMCTCGKLTDYYVLGAEEMEMFVDHSFTSKSTRWSIRGSSLKEQSTDYDKSVHTCVKKCRSDHLTGKRECDEGCYREFEPGNTMSMSLREWLSIGGVSLDERLGDNVVTPSKQEGADSTSFPFRRLAGTKLNVNLKYHGSADTDEHIICDVEVEVVDGWTSFGTSSEFAKYNGPTGDSEAYEFYRRGIAVQFFSDGQIYQLDHVRLLMVLVQGVALLKIADVVVEIVACWLLPEGAVYSRAKYEELVHARRLAQFGLNAAMLCQVFSSLNSDSDGGDHKISEDELIRAFSAHFSYADSKKIGHAVLQCAQKSGALDDDGGELTVQALVELMTTNECTLDDLQSKADQLSAPKQRCWSKARVEPQGKEKPSGSSGEAYEARP